MTTTKIDALASAYSAARRAVDNQKAILKQLEEEASQRETDLFDALENAGVRSVRVHGLGLFSMNDLAWARIADREKALAWADQQHPELLTLNHQQLSVMVRHALKGEGEMPEGIDFTTSRKINWRRTGE